MAAKRRRAESGAAVTGGTGDVKPQIMTLTTGVAGALSDYVVNQSSLPVPRFGTMKTKATVLEFLSLDWYINIENSGDRDTIDWAYLTTNSIRADADTATQASAAIDAVDPRTFGMVLITWDTSTAVGISELIMPFHVDLTDQAGNGILIATDNITVVMGSVNNAVAGQAICKVLYRLVNVGITEYVGIVQSQQ